MLATRSSAVPSGKADAAGGIGAGLDDVAFVDRVADMQRDRGAVAYDVDVADDLLHFADGVGRQRRPLRLRIMSGRRRAGQQIDEVAGKMRAVRRVQRRMLFAGEVIWDDMMLTVLAGQDEIGARSSEMPAEQKFRIGNVDAVRMRCVKMKNGRTNAVAALSRGPISHFAAPRRAPSERERLADPVSGVRAVTLLLGPNAQRAWRTMRYSGPDRKNIVNKAMNRPRQLIFV